MARLAPTDAEPHRGAGWSGEVNIFDELAIKCNVISGGTTCLSKAQKAAIQTSLKCVESVRDACFVLGAHGARAAGPPQLPHASPTAHPSRRVPCMAQTPSLRPRALCAEQVKSILGLAGMKSVENVESCMPVDMDLPLLEDVCVSRTRRHAPCAQEDAEQRADTETASALRRDSEGNSKHNHSATLHGDTYGARAPRHRRGKRAHRVLRKSTMALSRFGCALGPSLGSLGVVAARPTF